LTGRDALRWRNHADIPFRLGINFALHCHSRISSYTCCPYLGLAFSARAEPNSGHGDQSRLSWRLVGVYAGRVLKGAKPVELPVEQVWCMVGLSLMVAQAFFYNAIFFTYALVLTDFYGIPGDLVGWYLLPFAAGNFLGPVVLGRLFDTIGRRPMIAATYAVSGLLLAVAGYLFALGILSATAQTIAWMVIFFFASAAASSAYLTVSETFPLEVRALAIAFFYAVGTGIGGVAGPWFFAALIDTGSRWSVFGGYLLGSVLMLAAAVIAPRFGVAAERKPLESVSRPLAAAE
jgi:MFS family permease